MHFFLKARAPFHNASPFHNAVSLGKIKQLAKRFKKLLRKSVQINGKTSLFFSQIFFKFFVFWSFLLILLFNVICKTKTFFRKFKKLPK